MRISNTVTWNRTLPYLFCWYFLFSFYQNNFDRAVSYSFGLIQFIHSQNVVREYEEHYFHIEDEFIICFQLYVIGMKLQETFALYWSNFAQENNDIVVPLLLTWFYFNPNMDK